MKFWSRPDSWNSALRALEQSEKSGLLTLKQIETRKTFNTNIAYDILIFPTDIYTPKYNQRFESSDFLEID
jgi:hypothetical protein